MAAGLGAAATAAVGVGSASARAAVPATITIPGESPARTNIPVARDRRASGGHYLALLTAEQPPPDTGWYATYRVRVPHKRVYALSAVAIAPVETPHTEAVGSYLQLSVNDGPFREVARSQPDWYGSPAAWGDLSVLNLGEVELREGTTRWAYESSNRRSLTTASCMSCRWIISSCAPCPAAPLCARPPSPVTASASPLTCA